MTYSTDDAIKKIVDFKKQWEDANNAGDLVAKGNAEKYAKKVYEMMRANGDSAIADELSASNYTKAQQVKDTYYKANKTETRPYLYSLGEKYGMSQSEVDSIIGWDADTGEISLGGKKIGKPDALVGGSSYWNDPSVLDNAFSDYVTRTGKTMPTSTSVAQGNEDVMEKYKKIFQSATEENPYETEVGKSIMGKYNLAAIQGRENQLASGAATNGGNIDSFSAANALRQQAALIYQGQDAALAAHQQKIDNAQKILEGMGVHIDRMYNQDETTKNNEVSRDVAISEATGYSTDNQLKSLSSMWNNGELVDTKTDYQARINEVKVLYDNATTDEEKQTYGLALKLLEMGRNDKIAKTGSKESPTYNYQMLVPNSTTTITREQIASAERIAQNKSQYEYAQAALGLTSGNDDYPNQINADDPRFVDIVSQKDDGTYTVHGSGVDYYGSLFIEKMKEWLVTNYGRVINLDDENQRAAFVNAIPDLSKQAHVTLGQLRKVMDFIGVGGVIKVDELFENSSEKYTRKRDGAQWSDGVVKKQKDDSKTV